MHAKGLGVNQETRTRRLWPATATVLLPALFCVLTVCCARQAGQPFVVFAGIEHPTRPVAAGAVPAKVDETTPDARALLQEAQRRYEDQVEAYECTFWRQDRIKGRLTARQQIEILYRDSPRTILMKWVENLGQVRRALYAAGLRINKRGEECVLVEPANPAVRLCAPRVEIPVHGRRARSSSRYTIDQFGFGATLERIERANALAASRGTLTLRYAGVGKVDGRPTHVIERYLPYTGDHGDYPDAKLVVHLDQEWLLPVAIHSYADQDARELLGSYVTTNIKFHRKIDDELFKF